MRNPRRRTLPLRNAASHQRLQRSAIALDVIEAHLGYFVRRLQVWIFQDFIRTLGRIDISPAQFSVLVVISANRGPSQSELAATLGIERARLVRLLHRLEDAASLRGSRPTPTAAAMRSSSRRKGARCSRAPRPWRRATNKD